MMKRSSLQRKLAFFYFFMLLFWPAATLPALAHAELIAAMPAPGTMATEALTEIRLTFNEPVSAASEIRVFGADFQAVAGVNTQNDPANAAIIFAPLPELGPGTYTVQWTAVSDDGHEITGSYAFGIAATNLPFSTRQLWLIGLGLLIVSSFVILWRRQRPS